MALPNITQIAGAVKATGGAVKSIGEKINNKQIPDKKDGFFDKLLAHNANADKISTNKKNVADFMERQDKNIEQKRLLRRIADNTDTIIDLLRDQGKGGKDNSRSLLDLLKWLGLGLLAIPSFLNPEKTKLATTAIKAAPKVVQAGSKIVKEIVAGGKVFEAGSTAAKAAGIAGTALGAVGKTAAKFVDNKYVNNALRISSGAMIAGRAAEGDYVGAGMEGASLAAHEASRVIKNPRVKMLLSLASLATDGAIIGRDMYRGKKEEDRSNFAKENGINAPEKAGMMTGLMGWAGIESDQAKRIKEQEAALTPEQRAALQAYDENGGSSGSAISAMGDKAGSMAMDTISDAASGDGSGLPVGTIATAVSGAILGLIGIKAGGAVKPGESILDGVTGGLKSMFGGGEGSIIKKMGSLLPGFGKGASTAVAATEGVASGVGGTIAKKTAGKMMGRIIPGVGLALGAMGAYDRAKEGDYLGAAGEAISGITSLIPGLGTAATVAIQGGLAYRDYVKATATDTANLNTIAKDAVTGLEGSADANKLQMDANGKIIDQSNDVIKKNSNEMKESVKSTGSLLNTFTSSLGSSLTSWITIGSTVFSQAFSTLQSIGSDLLDVLKNTPVGDAIDTAIDTATESIDTASGQASLGAHGGSLTGTVQSHESGGNYGIYNKHVGNGKYTSGTVDYNNTTVDQIRSQQKAGNMNAFGGYQIIGKTLDGAKKTLGLKGDEKMTKELQDRIFQDHLIKAARPNMYKYLTGGTDLNAAIIAGAREWSSVGVPVDMQGHTRKVKKGESYYAGDGHNAAQAKTSPAEFGEGLKQQRNRFIALKKAGFNENDAYHKSFNKNALDGIKNITEKDKAGTGGSEASPMQKTTGFFGDVGDSISKAASAAGGQISRTLGMVDEEKNKKATAAAKTPPPKTGTISKDQSSAAVAGAAGIAGIVGAAGLSSSKEKEGKKDTKTSDADWDLDKIVAHAMKRAKAESTKNCALYVREALQQGDLRKKISGGLGDAKDVPSNLVKIGWYLVGSNLTSFQKGDIAVFPKTKHPAGHICIWSGSRWVSDYLQNKLQPYNGIVFPYNIYRAKNAISNGNAVNGSGEGSAIDATGASGDGALAGAGDGGGTEPEKNAGEKLIDGMAKVLTYFATSDTMKSAVDWLDSVKTDAHTVTQMGPKDLHGFDKKLYDQLDNGFQYKGGNGEKVNEADLFNPNLERQKASGSDLLGDAGKMNGIQRQNNVSRNLLGDAGYINPYTRQQAATKDWLGNAGYIDPKTRQNASKYDLLGEAGALDGIVHQNDIGYDLLGNAGYIGDDVRQGDSIGTVPNIPGYGGNGPTTGTGGIGDLKPNDRLDAIVKELDDKNNKAPKKKKQKWYDKLFGDSNSWLGQLANGMGFGDMFGFGQDIYNTSKSGDWGEFTMRNGSPIARDMLDPYGMGGLVDFGNDIFNTSKTGDWGGLAMRVASPALERNGLGDISATGQDIYNTAKNGGGAGWGGVVGRAFGRVLAHKDDHLKEDGGIAIPEIKTAPDYISMDGLTIPDIKMANDLIPSVVAESAEKPFVGIDSTPTNIMPGLSFESGYNGSNVITPISGPAMTLAPNVLSTTGQLMPDITSKLTLDEQVAAINRQAEQNKNAPSVATPMDISTGPSSSAIGNRGGGAGNQAPLITRNPDSIFREVSITMMRASTT